METNGKTEAANAVAPQEYAAQENVSAASGQGYAVQESVAAASGQGYVSQESVYAGHGGSYAPLPVNYPVAVPMLIRKAENIFKPDMLDFAFALVVFVLGYLFSRWVFFRWQGWGVTAFVTAYLLAVTVYLIRKNVFTWSREAWFWLTVTWLIGASYAFWGNDGIAAIRGLFLISAAVYFVLVASNRLVLGRTSNYLLVDGINSLIIIPCRNLINQYVSFSAPGRTGKRGIVLPTLLGLGVAMILLLILTPMLERADSGGFGMVLDIFRFNIWSFWEFVFYAAFAFPFAAYIYGLASGSAFGKGQIS